MTLSGMVDRVKFLQIIYYWLLMLLFVHMLIWNNVFCYGFLVLMINPLIHMFSILYKVGYCIRCLPHFQALFSHVHTTYQRSKRLMDKLEAICGTSCKSYYFNQNLKNCLYIHFIFKVLNIYSHIFMFITIRSKCLHKTPYAHNLRKKYEDFPVAMLQQDN